MRHFGVTEHDSATLLFVVMKDVKVERERSSVGHR